MKKLVRSRSCALMLITHDLAVRCREMADRIVVMYCGRIVEQGCARRIIDHPSPYTRA